MADKLTPNQKKLVDLFLTTQTEAKVLRRKTLSDGKFEFYHHVRKTSPIDFPVNEEEFAIKVHEKKPDTPLTPIYVNLRNLPDTLVEKIGKVLSEVEIERTDFCTGIPNTANAFAKEYSRFSKVPYLDLFEKIGSPTDRKLVPLKEAKKGEGKTLLIIDDVISQGNSKFEAIDVAEKLGYKVSILVLIDRNQGGFEYLKNKGYRIYRAMSILSILDYLLKIRKIDQKLYKDIKLYLSK